MDLVMPLMYGGTAAALGTGYYATWKALQEAKRQKRERGFSPQAGQQKVLVVESSVPPRRGSDEEIGILRDEYGHPGVRQSMGKRRAKSF